MSQRQKGYTLTEIVVAIAVIGILAGATTPLIFKQIEKSKIARAKTEIETLKSAFIQYYADTSYWPCSWDAAASSNVDSAFATFSCLYTNDSNKGWDGPYLNQSGGQTSGGATVVAQTDSSGNYQGIIDPWGRPFQIFEANTSTSGASAGTIVLYSLGKNGTEDTSDANKFEGLASSDDIVLVVTKRAKGN